VHGLPLIPVPIYGGQNVLKIFEMTIRHNRWTTRTEPDSFLSLDLFSLRSKIFLSPSFGGRGVIASIAPYGSATGTLLY